MNLPIITLHFVHKVSVKAQKHQQWTENKVFYFYFTLYHEFESFKNKIKDPDPIQDFATSHQTFLATASPYQTCQILAEGRILS